MCRHRSVNCIVPPHILQKMMQSPDKEIRDIALSTLLSTTRLRAERQVLSQFAFLGGFAGQKRRTIFDCRQRRLLDQAVLVRNETDGPAKDSSIDGAFDGLGATYDFYKEVFQRNSIDDHGKRLDGYVHFGRNYNNAFWDGRQMVFGDGDGRIFRDFTQSLDVIAHELTHGVTEFTAGLEYHNQSGALNESMSDVFGSLVKQRYRKETADQADWLIGDDIFTPEITGDALRSLKNPGTAYDDPLIGRDPQPGHMDNFVGLPDTEEGDWGGVHINSGIPNHAFYLFARSIGGFAWETPGLVWYESLKASGPSTEFQEFADRTFDTSGRLFGAGSAEQQAVQTAWREVGIRVNAGQGVSVVARPQLVTASFSTDPQAVLVKQIEALAGEVKALSKEVSQLKKSKAVAA